MEWWAKVTAAEFAVGISLSVDFKCSLEEGCGGE